MNQELAVATTRIQQWLKRSCPRLYQLLKRLDERLRLTYTWRMLRARLTDSRARYWSQQGEEEIRKTWEARHAPNNRYLWQALGNLDFVSLLELGSNCGNRLAVISAARPEARLAGIDINRLAVSLGNRWLAEEKIRNARLCWGRIEDLSPYGDQSFDVVFSWAALMYVRPARILSALRDILRVCRKAVVLIEMQNGSKGEDRRGVYCAPGNWKRDYVGLLEEAGAERSRIAFEWVDKSLWNPGGGGGACIRYVKV